MTKQSKPVSLKIVEWNAAKRSFYGSVTLDTVDILNNIFLDQQRAKFQL